MSLVILEVMKSKSHDGDDGKLVKSVEEKSGERFVVVDPVRGLQTAVEESNPHPQHHSILPFAYAKVIPGNKTSGIIVSRETYTHIFNVFGEMCETICIIHVRRINRTLKF